MAQSNPDSAVIMRVSTQSRPPAVAGAIAAVLRQERRVEILTIGAGALNQAVKAIAIARGYLVTSGLDLVCVPSFISVTIADEECTGLRLVLETR